MRENAQRDYMDAIAFVLGDPSEYDRDTQAIVPEMPVVPCMA
jgi:hypothetical protein